MQVGTVSAKESHDQFMQLLVTQLQNQDPLDPIKQYDFISQLAQFSTLEGIEKLSDQVEQQAGLQAELLQLQQLSQAAELVGRNVTYQSASTGDPTQGIVESVSLTNGRLQLNIGEDTIGVDQLIDIHSPGETDKWSTTALMKLANLL
jgi:flagellar basal-body rod modification protein FlgD